MSLTVKVWCPNDEPEPEGLFNKASCPDAPPNWFKEWPEVAAELYALERPTITRVTILDDAGQTHQFNVRTARELTAHVSRAE